MRENNLHQLFNRLVKFYQLSLICAAAFIKMRQFSLDNHFSYYNLKDLNFCLNFESLKNLNRLPILKQNVCCIYFNLLIIVDGWYAGRHRYIFIIQRQPQQKQLTKFHSICQIGYSISYRWKLCCSIAFCVNKY